MHPTSRTWRRRRPSPPPCAVSWPPTDRCPAAKSALHCSCRKHRSARMRERKAPRYQGTITSWKDEQGFGFIAPNGGGPAVFVHIKAFARRGVRPTEHAIVTYE